MFDNIGRKLKSLAGIVFGIGALICVIAGITLWSAFGRGLGFLLFLLISVGGTLMLYVSVMAIYAFGELVENSAIIAENTMTKHTKKGAKSGKNSEKDESAEPEPSTDSASVEELSEWKNQGARL